MMKIKQTLAIIFLVAFTFSCKSEQDVLPKNLTASSWSKLSKARKALAFEQIGHISKLEINNISLQRVSNGATRVFPSYVYNYATPVKLFANADFNAEVYNIYIESTPNGPVVNPQVEDEVDGPDLNKYYIKVVNTIYEVDVSDPVVSGSDLIFICTVLPPAAVAGVSADHSTLITALNSAGSSSVARPNLVIPADLKVLSFANIKLTIVISA